MSNLAKYASLHRLVNDLNLDEDSTTEEPRSEDHQVIASVGGVVMALGMTLIEATETKLTEDQTNKLFGIVNTLAPAALLGYHHILPVIQSFNDDDGCKPDAVELTAIGTMIAGLEEVPLYVADRQRAKPDPL